MVTLYVEGGGDRDQLHSACRQGLREFLEKAGFHGHMPRIRAKGGRTKAYDSFRTALAKGTAAMLLVDSEGPVAPQHQSGNDETWQPWLHLRQRPGDHWDKPQGATDADCHLMAQCTESWLLADGAVLRNYFGQGFRDTALPGASRPIEDVPKEEVQRALATATRNSQTKGEYNKGRHSFELLAKIDPAKVASKCPWAARFLKLLRQRAAS